MKTRALCSMLAGFLIILALPMRAQEIVQGSSGLPGGEAIAPIVVQFEDLPVLKIPYVGPEYELPEVKPPPMEPFPAPHASDLLYVTIDPAALNSLLAPNIGTGFEGVTQTGSIPSEPQPAVGPNHVVVLGNVTVVVYNKDGTSRTEVSQSSFFNIPPAEGPGFDAKCYYDALRGRFVLLSETKATSPNVSKYYLAISQTSNARGSWYTYSFDMTKDGTTQTSNWSDFPGLGVSDDKIVMSGQQFTFSGDIYQYQKLRVVDRALAYSGGPLTYVDFANFTGQVFVTKPGRNVSRDSTIHLLATRSNGGNNVVYFRITGPPSSPILSTAFTVSVQSYGAVVNAKGGSGANSVEAGDARTPDFFVRNGILHIAWHFGINFGSGTVDAIRYLKLRTSDRAVLNDETFGADGIYYYYPMVCVDSVGTAFLGFGRSSASEFPSSYVSGKRRSDANIQPSALAKAGTAVTSQPRWGDYTGIDMDETASGPASSVAWYSGQWTKTSNNFGTWATQLTFPYNRIAGQVLFDADGNIGTTGDRSPLSGWTATLKQGPAILGTSVSDAGGNYSFGYMDTGTYDVILTQQTGTYVPLDVVLGTGGTSQTRLDSLGIQIAVTAGTSAQLSSGNLFLQKSPLSVAVMSPNGGEVWPIGFTQSIQWTSSGFTGNVKIELSRNGGGGYETLMASIPNTGSANWVVTVPTALNALIRISSVSNPSVVDVSDGAFTISPSMLFLAKIVLKDNGGTSDSLEFGAAAGATDGIDPEFGENELPPPPPTGVLDVRWKITGTQGAKRDVRDTLGGARTRVTYIGAFQVGAGGYPFRLRWNRFGFPPGTFTLRDQYGGSSFLVNMKQQDSLVISNDELQLFQIVYDAGDVVYSPVQPGWNIVSLPLTVSDPRKTTLFPTSTSSAFAFTPGGYVSKDTLRNGQGYWLKFPSMQLLSLGGGLRNLDTMDVVQGWNIIGSISGVVPVGGIIQIPSGIVVSPFFGFAGGTYNAVSFIHPMQGYWVKASQSGRLVMIVPGSVAAPSQSGDGE